jgi:alpha-mannosidase
VRSTPVSLSYDLAAASNGGQHSEAGFDGKGNSLPAEMLPAEITFNDVQFKLVDARTGSPNAVTAKGQSIDLPAGRFNRVYLLAASAAGDQKATFDLGGKQTELDIQDWGGFIGQWDDRQWSGASLDVDHAKYGDMTGLKQGYIKRADLAWYSDHHHDADGKNVTYRYSYLFGYAIDLPPGTKTIKLPQNDKIRILAISVADGGPKAQPAQPLYDVLPSPNAHPGGTNYAGSLPGATIAATTVN